MRGFIVNSQATKTLCSANVETGSVENLFEINRRLFVCNICRENCDTKNKHIICMLCNFYYHL